MKQFLLFALSFFVITTACAQVTKTVNVGRPGTLVDLLTSDEMNAITDLTVTGNVDARDFAVIRDMLPKLVKLDLSSSKISAYNGKDGTMAGKDNPVCSYKANEIPTYSFTGVGGSMVNRTLESVIVPTSTTSIAHHALLSCEALKTITISTVTSIETAAFGYCPSLASININAAVPPVTIGVGTDIFAGIDFSNCTLYVPQGSVPAYKAAYEWKNFTNVLEMVITGIEEQQAQAICIYPNESADVLCIQGLAGEALLSVYDGSGRLMSSQNVAGDTEVPVSQLAKGVYVARLTSSQATISRKFIRK